MIKNSIKLIGRLGKDVELKKVGNSDLGKTTIAVNEKYKNAKGEDVTTTNWFSLTFWGKSAELANKYLTKGSEVIIEGSVKTGSYEKGGMKIPTFDVVVDTFLVTSEKRHEAEKEVMASAETDDLPY